MKVLAAAWEPPSGVRAFTTLRSGGVSSGSYASLNLGAHVGDEAERVRQNRTLVREASGWSTEPLWLNQVHGTTIVVAGRPSAGSAPPSADGAVTEVVGLPLVVMTADCLPVVACDRQGTVVGAFHAGWKGLLAGVLEQGLAAMNRRPEDILVWIGPGIGAESYQVGAEVRAGFLASDPEHAADFEADGPDHWRLDLAAAAARRLDRAGVTELTTGSWDTFRDTDLFFSHRREAPCGRMGTFICLESRS